MKNASVNLMKKAVRSGPVRQQMRLHPAAAARTVSLIRRLQREPDETKHGRRARYCYGVWLRHVERLKSCGLTAPPRCVAEVGPGDTIGVGVAALLSGTQELFALDSQRYLSVEATLDVLPQLVDLFTERAAIPDERELPDVKPYLSGYSFPRSILGDEVLSASLAPWRIDAIRRAIRELDKPGFDTGKQDDRQVSAAGARGASCRIEYRVDWSETSLEPSSVDLILSQAVMEHVADIDTAYRSFAGWLVPGGRISHQIDFRSHGTSFDWNGHWTYDRKAWDRVANTKTFRWINRRPLSAHVEAAQAAGLDVQLVQPITNADGAPKTLFAPPFADMSEADASCQGALLVAQRPR